MTQTTPTPDQSDPETTQPPIIITPAPDETTIIETEQMSIEEEQTSVEVAQAPEGLTVPDPLPEAAITQEAQVSTTNTSNSSAKVSGAPITALASDTVTTTMAAAADLTDIYETKSFVVMYDPEEGRYIIIDKASRIALGYTLKPYYMDEEILENIIYFGANPNTEEELFSSTVNMPRKANPSYNQDALIKSMGAMKSLETSSTAHKMGFSISASMILWTLATIFVLGVIIAIIFLVMWRRRRDYEEQQEYQKYIDLFEI